MHVKTKFELYGFMVNVNNVLKFSNRVENTMNVLNTI